MYIFDGIPLDGYPELSPFGLAAGQTMGIGAKRQQFSDAVDANGATLAKESTQENATRSIPLEIYSRFTSTYTNLVTNPRPASTTSWAAVGSIGSGPTLDTTNFKLGANSIKVVTNGNANTGISVSFTATAVAHSGSIWVNAPSGAPMAVLFDSAASTAFTGTGDWQLVKTENITLTAATRKLQVIQTDAGTRTFQVNAACVTATSTATRYFDGTVGDAIWTGTADASNSTTLTGEYGIAKAIGTLANVTKKAEKYADRDPKGVPLTIVGPQLPYIMTADCISADLEDFPVDISHFRGLATGTLTCTCMPLAYGAEYTVGSASKAIGTGALEVSLTGVKGDEMCPTRVQVSDTSGKDFGFVCMGIQGRDYVSGTSLIAAASSFTTSGYSGSLTAATTAVQTLSKSGTILGGTFTLTFTTVTDTATAAINFNDNAATVQTKIEAVIGAGNCTVTGGPISTTTLTFTFAGNLASLYIPQMVVTSSLTGGGTVTMGTTTAGSAAYVSSGLYSTPTTICDTGNLSHIGSYRVWARVLDNAATSDLYESKVRLSWGTGDLASVTTNNWATPQAVGDYSLIDLGQIHIPVVATGTQRWTGRIEGKTSGTAGNTIRILSLMLVPIETGAGEVRVVDSGSSTISMFDNFGATSGALTGDTATSGQTWASMAGHTSGTDFTQTAAPANSVIRTAISDTSTNIAYGRGVILGSGTATNVSVAADVKSNVVGIDAYLGVIARFVDNDNFVAAAIRATYPGQVYIAKVVGGVVTVLGWPDLPTLTAAVAYELELTVRASGSWTASVDGTTVASGVDSALATGGTLASGKSGLIDWQTSGTTNTRTYSNFSVSFPSAQQVACYHGQDLQFRDNGDVLRAASGGSVYSVPSRSTVAIPPQLTPTVNEGLTNRLLILASRNNPDLAGDSFSDTFSATVYSRPVYRLARWEA